MRVLPKSPLDFELTRLNSASPAEPLTMYRQSPAFEAPDSRFYWHTI
jgi:hypothetical protein